MKRNFRVGQLGIGTVGVILLIPLLLIAALIGWIVFAEARKNYWDGKVRDLCAKDGGVKVIENVYVPKAEYADLTANFGSLSIQAERFSSGAAPFFTKAISTHLRQSNPEVLRSEQQLIRRRDSKIIGTLVTYIRIGGDVGFSDNPTSLSCSPSPGNWFSQVIHMGRN